MTYAQPLLLLCCGLLLGGLALVRTRLGRRLAWCGLLGLFLVSWPPADWIFAPSARSPLSGAAAAAARGRSGDCRPRLLDRAAAV